MQAAPININTKGAGENLKTVAIIGIGVGALFVINKVLSMVGNEAENRNEKKTEEAIKAIQVNTSRLSGNMLIYRTAADKLYSELTSHVLAVDTYSFKDVRQALNGFNTDELKQVIKEFGLRPAKLFDLFEAGAEGSFFEWCDAILDKSEREAIREIFIFTGLDVLPLEGMKYYWQYDDDGLFESENKHRALAARWKPFRTSTTKRKVYPVKGNSQYLSVLEQTATGYISKSIKAAGYGAIGEYTAYDKTIVENGIAQNIYVKITDPRLGSWLGKTIVVGSREMNQDPPINNTTLYPL